MYKCRDVSADERIAPGMCCPTCILCSCGAGWGRVLLTMGWFSQIGCTVHHVAYHGDVLQPFAELLNLVYQALGFLRGHRPARPLPSLAAPARNIDEDYDKGVAETSIGLASYRAPEQRATFPLFLPIFFRFAQLPLTIKGLGVLSIDAIGVGDVTLRSRAGNLILRDVFFVPQSSVRLVSIFLLNNPSSGAPYSTHFYSNRVYITDHTNSVIAQGSVLPNRKLYILSDFTLHVPPPPSSHSSAHYASRPPDVDCWHRRLGHCNPKN